MSTGDDLRVGEQGQVLGGIESSQSRNVRF